MLILLVSPLYKLYLHSERLFRSKFLNFFFPNVVVVVIGVKLSFFSLDFL